MNKKSSKVLLTSIMLILTLSMMALLTGCGGPSTLEEYINDNKSEQEEMEKLKDSISQDGMDCNIEVKDNAMIFTVKLDQAITDDQLAQLKPMYDQFLDSFESEAQKVIKEFEEDSKIEGVTMSFTFIDKNEKEICTREYSAGK